MQTTEKLLFEKVAKLAHNVKQDFKNKGLVVPTRLPNGNIQVGNFVIARLNHQFFVRDKKGKNVIGPLNLAQTAVLIANDLALGRIPDPQVLDADTWYGYKAFDEEVSTNIAERARKEQDHDRADLSQYKASVAHQLKLQYKKGIEMRFNKLCKLT